VRWLAVAISVAGIIYLLVWYVPAALTRRNANATVESAFISAVAGFLGVVATAAVAITAFWYSRSTNQATIEAAKAATDRTVEAARETNQAAIDAAREAQFPDRYAKAIEQLGSDELNVRIGGIYALERIAHDSPLDHPTVIEVLATFVRENGRELWRPPTPRPGEGSRGTRPDVQAAIAVIGRRSSANDRWIVDISAANLYGAKMIDAYLRGARLTGAILIGAKLLRADLTDADLSQASLNQAELHDAHLDGAKLGADLTNAEFQRAHLTGADFNGARLIGTIFAYADLQGANLTSQYLTDAGFLGANLTGANLTAANLTGTHLRGANLTGARLVGAQLNDAWLDGADFTGADLTSARLLGAHLDGADFTDADLTDAYWSAEARIPEGWQRDAESGCLKRANTSSGDTAAS
jgi:uncharacterized protein YjbI with pentapeptide repeats